MPSKKEMSQRELDDTVRYFRGIDGLGKVATPNGKDECIATEKERRILVLRGTLRLVSQFLEEGKTKAFVIGYINEFLSERETGI